MARLILLNGAPGLGKSTLARRYVAEHPLAFCLDIDEIRRLIGGWQDRPAESGRLARAMALAMLREHLRAGHDVIVPQYLGRPEFIDELEQAAAEVGARFHEIVLADTRDNALRRFAGRASDPALATHHAEAAAMVGGDAGLAELYDRLAALLSKRPHARVIETTAGAVESDYEQLRVLLSD